jgi:hypothetical protein
MQKTAGLFAGMGFSPARESGEEKPSPAKTPYAAGPDTTPSTEIQNISPARHR